MSGLGDRMKQQYEDRYRILLPRRTYTVIRVDGHAFHTYAHRMQRPFSDFLRFALCGVAVDLCRNAQGACFAYQQSDEVSLLLADFSNPGTEAWFDGNLQKLVSHSASIATQSFAKCIRDEGLNGGWRGEGLPVPRFDARAFVIPDPVEVENYFIWRQKDWARNSLQMLARSLYSAKELKGKKMADLHELLHAKGRNWVDLAEYWKNGSLCWRRDGAWMTDPAFVFTRQRGRLTAMVPKHWEDNENE